MYLTTSRIKEVFPDFNERPHDESDFWRAAKKERVIVREEPLLIDGYYKVCRNKPYILINSELAAVDWLLTAFHELAHHLLDAPYKKSSVLLYRDLQVFESKQERRAEQVALVLLVPQKQLAELENTPFDELHPYTQKLLIKRQRIYEEYGI